MDNEKKVKVWEDYTVKANNFSDWFTAIIISNFAYLITLLDNELGIQDWLGQHTYLWRHSFYASCAALFFIFIVKGLGVLAASMRVHEDNREKSIEDVRVFFLFIFGICGLYSLIVTTIILENFYKFTNL